MKKLHIIMLTVVLSLLSGHYVLANDEIAGGQTLEPTTIERVQALDLTNLVTADLPTAKNLSELASYFTKNARKLENEFSIQYVGDFKELQKTVVEELKKAIILDSYAHGVLDSYNISILGNRVTFKVTYRISKEEQAFVSTEISRILEEIITPSMTDFEKVFAINNYIVTHTTYSYDSKTTPHASYALFKEGKGVCQAYAMAAYEMLQKAGLEVHYVTGYAGEPHAWNLVKIDGEWYHLDTTWNDPVFDRAFNGSERYIQYSYFLLSDKEIFKNRTMDYTDLFPKATSERFLAVSDVSASVINYNGIDYLIDVQRVGDQLYYVKQENGKYNLYSVNIMVPKNMPQRISTIQSLNFIVTPKAIYYIDVQNHLGVSKFDFETKQSKALYTSKNVHRIQIENNQLKAFVNNQVVYTETVELDPFDGDTEAANTFKTLQADINKFEIYDKNFSTNANRILSNYQKVGEKGATLLTDEERKKVAEIKQKLERMNQVSFSNLRSFGPERQISDSKKDWALTFSTELKDSAENKKKIKVYDMFGDEVEVAISIEKNQIKLSPVGEYMMNIPYTLVIEAGIENSEGIKLKRGTHLLFSYANHAS